MKNVLVTGGTGFIGSHTVVELAAAGYQPIIVDNFNNSDPSVLGELKEITGQDLVFYEGDFRDQKLMKQILSEHELAGVIHFAAYKSVAESMRDPLKYYSNNVAGFVDLLEVLTQNKASRLVFSSSCIVYAEAEKLPISEDEPVKPALSPYGASKQICEQVLKDTAAKGEQLSGIALRYFNVIGAHSSAKIGEKPKTEEANLVTYINRAASGNSSKLTVFGDKYDTPDGTCIRDFIHVTDLAKAHVKALDHLLEQDTGYYDVFNVGTGKGTTILQTIEAFQEATGQKIAYEVGPPRPGDIIKSYADAAKAKRVLGWQAEKTLNESLADGWRWQQTLKQEP